MKTIQSRSNGSHTPEWVQRGRVPSLDGLRAIAIGVVISFHMNFRLQTGHSGVTLFFVISGFIITLLILRENDKTNGINLRRFYWRRFVRIVPALSFYLIFVLLIQQVGLIHIDTKYWLAAITYTICYMDFNSVKAGTAWDIGHTWSLSVEEHFYLLWPVLFFWLKPLRAFKTLLCYLTIIPVFRYLLYHYMGFLVNVNSASITEMGSIGMGCIVAFMAHGSGFAKLNAEIQKRPNVTFLLGIFLLVGQFAFGSAKIHAGNLNISGLVKIVLGAPVDAMAFALILLAVLYYPQSAMLVRVLNSRPLVYIGTLSYSLYLWQQLFTGYGVFAHRPNFWGHWLTSIALIVLCSLASFYGIETPLLRLKHRSQSPLVLRQTSV